MYTVFMYYIGTTFQQGVTTPAMLFSRSEGVNTSEIHGEIRVQYGGNCMGQRKLHERVQILKGGRRCVKDKPSDGHRL